ncbi:MAG: RnfABCDGE type electron transport complex subunit D [Bdellovibrionales bacterium]|nr:RnfABCDGE type electron transport complex subunit D [Bdellovibrionales bacterium]
MKHYRIDLTIPKLGDPRILFLIFTMVFLFLGLRLPSFGGNFFDYCMLAGCCMIFDFILRKMITGEWVFPLSGLTTAFGIFIVCDVIDNIYYLPIAFLAMGSKAFLQIQGRHIFNPGAFAIVISNLGLVHAVSPEAILRWTGDLKLSLFIFLCGLFLAIKVRRWAVVLAFYGVSILVSPTLSLFSPIPPLSYVHNLMWEGIVIMAFFMLTDPKTSPSHMKNQLLYGGFIAILAQYLRFLEFRLPEHTALLVGCLVYAIFRKYSLEKDSAEVWKIKEVHIELF